MDRLQAVVASELSTCHKLTYSLNFDNFSYISWRTQLSGSPLVLSRDWHLVGLQAVSESPFEPLSGLWLELPSLKNVFLPCLQQRGSLSCRPVLWLAFLQPVLSLRAYFDSTASVRVIKQLFVCFCCAGWGYALLKQPLAYFQTTELAYDSAGATPSWGGGGEGWLSLEHFSRGLPWRTFVWQLVGPLLARYRLNIGSLISHAKHNGGPWAGSASVREDIPDTVIMQHDEEALICVYLAFVF